jgi:hypothetical protein
LSIAIVAVWYRHGDCAKFLDLSQSRYYKILTIPEKWKATVHVIVFDSREDTKVRKNNYNKTEDKKCRVRLTVYNDSIGAA